MTDEELSTTQAMYNRVCESYHAVDDFRMKLLGLLPVATGTAVFLLLSGEADLIQQANEEAEEANTAVGDALLAIGLFGFLFTIGLFAYELFGIKKCHYLISAGSRLERELEELGQFRARPRELAGIINETFASAVIYPASMAAWLYLALSVTWPDGAVVAAPAVLLLGAAGTLLGTRRMKGNEEREDLVMTVVGDKRTRSDVRDDAQKQWNAHRKFHRSKASSTWVDKTVRRLQEQRRLEPDDDECLRPRVNGPWLGPPPTNDGEPATAPVGGSKRGGLPARVRTPRP
jgi:hypothetical protein